MGETIEIRKFIEPSPPISGFSIFMNKNLTRLLVKFPANNEYPDGRVFVLFDLTEQALSEIRKQPFY